MSFLKVNGVEKEDAKDKLTKIKNFNGIYS